MMTVFSFFCELLVTYFANDFISFMLKTIGIKFFTWQSDEFTADQ